MKELILELKRKREEQLEYQKECLSSDKSVFPDAFELTEKAIEVAYSDAKIQQIDDIIFFLEEGQWEDEIPVRITRG